VHDHRPAAGERLHAGTGGQNFLVVLKDLAERVRGAGPAQLAVAPSQHDPGGVNCEQLLGRDHGLLQRGGQVSLGIQVGQCRDALGQQNRVDGHDGVAFFRSPNWRTRSTGQARSMPWGADQAQQPPLSWYGFSRSL